MTKIYGLVGINGKLGTLLRKRPDFVSIDCDITDVNSIMEGAYKAFGELKKSDPYPVIVNCAGISSVDQCEEDYDKAIKVNVNGLSNLHKVFGKRVLNISSDYVFSGKNWFLPKENTAPNPVNSYGFTKLGAEAVSNFEGGKTIRLSRVVSVRDPDIYEYLFNLKSFRQIEVPNFIYRNYLTRYLAVNGIEYFVRNYDSMPSVVNYGGLENVSMYQLVKTLAEKIGGYDLNLIHPRKKDLKELTPRPKRGGFNVSLAEKLGFPMYSFPKVILELWNGHG